MTVRKSLSKGKPRASGNAADAPSKPRRTRSANAEPPASFSLSPPFAAQIAPAGVTRILADQVAFDAALVALRALDPPAIGGALAITGPPVLRRREPGFEGLAWIVVAQQLSTASASAIFARLKAALSTVDAVAIREAQDQTLRDCGLSAGKVRTLRGISDAVSAGVLDFARLATAPADEAHAALVALKGIGPWTADIFLLFCLGHGDAWPAGDLALQESVRRVLALDARPTEKDMRLIGERWRPWRGVAAHLLWSYYHVAVGRVGVP